MVVVKISDGLGNQMFQYATGRSIAIKRGETLKLETSAFSKNYKLRNYLLEKFNIDSYELTLFEKMVFEGFYRLLIKIFKKTISIKIFSFSMCKQALFDCDKKIFSSDCNYFVGYWQNCIYFNEIRLQLLEDFTLKDKPNKANQNMLQKIKTSDSVSIHIRRGDYIDTKGLNVCDLDYYQGAIKYISNLLSKPIFFIFSDDIAWVKKNLKLNYPVKYMDFNDNNPEWDLELMKNCKYNIIANSTFSWWGAWLNNNENKVVVGPKEWRKGFPTPDALMMKNMILL